MNETEQARPNILLGLRVVLIASLLLFLIATLTEIYRSPSSSLQIPSTDRSAVDNLIVPGVRIGAATLGLPSESLTKLFGKGQLRPHEDGIVYLFEDFGLAVYTEDDQVQSVTARSPHFKTRGGVGVGSDVNAILQTLGRDFEKVGNEEKYVLHNWSQGWHIGVEDSLVTYLQITATLPDGS